ncbi:MAG TPA: DUF881 domain-containing protein [Candidatus Limnocylindria bacterium]|nr:DUF881 domain-containing protein [Candidatus Limnocylindria bacterium]
MTTAPSADRTRLAHSLVLLLPAVLFGLLVSVQWRTQSERNELTVRYNTPLLDAAKTLQNEQNTLKVQLAELRADLDTIQANASTQSGAAKDLQARIDDLKVVAGLNERTGDGVTITLDDARSTVAAKDIEKSICHNTDLTDIVNQAWRGGAEAIAVNDERIVGSSSIYCVGSTIMVNGTLMSPPFSVVVIGPQNELLATYDDPTQLRDIKQRRDVYGLGFRVSRATGLRVPPYRGALNVRYATPR